MSCGWWRRCTASGADLGDPVEVTRVGGRILVSGVGVAAGRREKIQQALGNVPKVELRFAEPAAAAETEQQGGAETSVSSDVLNLHARLEKQVGGRAPFERLSAQLLELSDGMMSRAYALRRLAQRFPHQVEAELTPAERAVLRNLGREHAGALARQAGEMERLLAPVLVSLGGAAGAVPGAAPAARGLAAGHGTVVPGRAPGGDAAGGDAGRRAGRNTGRRIALAASGRPEAAAGGRGRVVRGRRHNGIDRRGAETPRKDGRRESRDAAKPRRLGASAVISAFLCLLLAASAAAQQRAHLAGLITDASDSVVPQALLTAVNEDTGFRRTAETQTDGRFVIASVEPGTYKVSVRRDGFRTMVRFGVRVAAGQTARVNFALSVGSMQETITVEGDATPLEREDAALRLELPRERIENLPLNGRGLLSLLELAPGTVATPATRGEAGQFTVNGQRPNTHYFTVDGVSANTGVSGGGLPAQSTGGALPGMSAFGSLHALISLEALREFSVETSSAMTEFGRLPGANVSLSSRSGTNDLHGALLYRFRHETLDANDWFANRYGEGRAPLRLHNFSAAAGGPLRRERTFFFLSYEHLTMRQPFAWRTPVPSLESRESAEEWLRPVLNLFPAPNGPNLGRDLAEWSGRNHRPSRLDAGGLRLDHAITPRMTMFARYHESPSLNEFGSTQINRLELRAKSLTAGVNARPWAGVTLEGRVNRSGARAASLWTQSGPGCELELLTALYLRREGSCDYLVRLNIAGVGELVSGREGVRKQTQYQAIGGASIERGNHDVRLGADYRRLAPSRHEATGTLSVIADSISDLEANRNPWVAHADARYGSAYSRNSRCWRRTPGV